MASRGFRVWTSTDTVIFSPDTELFCEGEPVKREDEDRLDEVGCVDVGGCCSCPRMRVDLLERRSTALTDAMHMCGDRGSGSGVDEF